MPERIAFPQTRQGVRDLDRVEGYVVPYSVGPASAPQVNVATTERWLSAVGGGALVVFGLVRRTWPALGLAVAGGALLYRGVTGHCPGYQSLGFRTAGPPPGESNEELVHRYR